MPDAPPARYPDDIRPLTSLRFAAALTVVVYHFSYFMPPAWNGLSGIFAKGYLAVDFFFILSGFILTHAYLGAVREGVFSARQFYVRRFARIYPMHILTLLVMIPVGTSRLHFGPAGYWPGSLPVQAIFTNLLLIHGWGVERHLGFNLPSWSISAEWFAYLCFPLLLPLAARARPGRLFLGAMAGFCVLWSLSYGLHPARPLTRLSADFSPLRIAPEFLIGVSLYLLARRRTGGPDRAGLTLAATGLLIALAIHFAAPDLVLIPLFAAAIYGGAELSRREDGGGWLARPLPVWLGEISYGVYMVHYVVMVMLIWRVYLAVPQARYVALLPVLLPGAVVLSVAAAGLLFPVYERPLRRLITGRLLHRPAARGRRGDPP